MRRTIGIAILIIGLAACSPDSGTVVDKDYHGAYYQTIMVPYTCGKSTCMRPQINYIPECYKIIMDTGSRCVSETEYSTISIGDYWQERD